MRYVIATLLGLSLVGGTAFASNSAKPGDFLFPVKKAREQLEVTFAANDQAKANLQSKFAEERVNDLLEAKANASSTPVSSQVAAENEASSALATLLRVQTDLAAKGNTEAASAIGQTIARLQLKLETNGNQGNHGHDGGDQNSDGNQNNPDGNGRHGGSNTSPLLQLNTSADLQATASTSTQFRVNSHGDEETEQEGLPSVEGTSTVNSNLRLKIHNHSRDDD